MAKLTESDRAARLQIQEKRLLAMREGAEELAWWLRDLVHHGLASAQQQGADFWDDIARRMVDTKLGGLAKRIRLMKDLLKEENWPERILRELVLLHLVTEGLQRPESLPNGLWADLLQFAGVNLKKEEVLQSGHTTNDCWLVLGISYGEEEKLRFRRTWLIGERSENEALLLDFAWGRNEFEGHWETGQIIEGELAYYPSAYPQRALLKGEIVIGEYRPLALRGMEDVAALHLRYARALRANPWLPVIPALLEGFTPWVEKGQFFLSDVRGRDVRVFCTEEAGWRLVSLGAGRPIQVFGEWDGNMLWVN